MGLEFGSSVFRAELAGAEREMRSRIDVGWITRRFTVLHMDKKAMVDHFRRIGAACADLRFKTKDVPGALDFCVWEYVIESTVLEDVQYCPYKKGNRGKAFCAATIHWKDDKICGNSDHGV
ncbi:hypothetical protein DL764_004937 [Monosporascus ibericus]|uniref:Uncharacterized protein n=1 Tax=Monosporascus ibericus TaxID=155417 RepID=A0A4Q4TCT8_9PEZI|nr:hypothetical protein DL764_004937 [Monosporascus ibericus]